LDEILLSPHLVFVQLLLRYFSLGLWLFPVDSDWFIFIVGLLEDYFWVELFVIVVVFF